MKYPRVKAVCVGQDNKLRSRTALFECFITTNSLSLMVVPLGKEIANTAS